MAGTSPTNSRLGGVVLRPYRWPSTFTFTLALGLCAFAPACGSTIADGGSGDGGSGGAGSGGAPTGGQSDVGEIAYLKSANAESGDFFGAAVALSADGTTLVVGAPGEASSATGVNGDSSDNALPGAGAAYIFSSEGDGWSQEAYVKASRGGTGDAFGTTIALSADGSTLAIGAPYEASAAHGVDGDETDDSSLDVGAVYVFERIGSVWSQAAYLKASNSDAEDYFGISLALSADGRVLAVGAEGEDSSSAEPNSEDTYDSGAVYVFEAGASGWQERDILKAPNAGPGDCFGGSVALGLDGSVLAVGAYREDSAATGIDGDQSDDAAGTAGAVYLFRYGASGWQTDAYLKGTSADGNAGDQFGAAVSLAADAATLAVGAVGDAAGTGTPYAGMAYVFEHDGAGWLEAAALVASNAGPGDEFGYHLQLAADGESLVIGAALEASSSREGSDENAPASGAVYRFRRGSAGFEQAELIKAPHVDAGDRFGWALALSEDGSRLVVGATREASATPGIDGDQTDDSAPQAGAAYVIPLAVQ